MKAFLSGNRPQAPSHERLGNTRFVPLIQRRKKPARLGRRRLHDDTVVQHDSRLNQQQHQQHRGWKGERRFDRRLAALPGHRTANQYEKTSPTDPSAAA